MARIDTSELLSDPDFIDTILVIRTKQVVGANGRSVDTPVNYPNVVAVVQPASGQQQKLLAETTRGEGSIAVYSKFRFKQVQANYAGDQIIWQNSRYTVENVNDFSNWGSGYQQAICSLKDLVTTDD